MITKPGSGSLRFCSAVVAVCAVGVVGAHGATVPGDYATIQAALDDLMFGSLPSGTVIDVLAGAHAGPLVYANSPKSFTLRGVAGAATTVIDAGGASDPAITIRDTTGVVRIEGFTITGGNGDGGVLFQRASPTLADCVVQGNHTSSNGGGVQLFESNGRIVSCTVQNNTAANSGGGIMIVAGSEVEIVSSRIENNQAGTVLATGSGGGIQVNDASVTIRSTVVTGNQAEFAGGGIFAIGIFGSANGRTELTVEDSEVSNNTSNDEGGGMHIEDHALAVVNRSTISDNTSVSGGGLNTFRARYEVTDSFIENNQAIGLASGNAGGGIHAISSSPQASSVVLTRSVVRNNQALNAGGILVAGGDCGGVGVCADLSMTDSLVADNIASFQGGGINVTDAVMTVKDSHIQGNQLTSMAGGAFGGGVRVFTSTAMITGTTIAGNTAGEVGGGIFVEGGSDLTVDQSFIYGNSALTTNGGGGLFVGSAGPSTGIVQNSVIADNSEFQIREQSCPGGVDAPILSYANNTITSEGVTNIYFSPCFPPGAVTDIATFNNISPGNKTVGNDSLDPSFTSFASMPPRAPSVLAWTVPRTLTVTIDNVAGPQTGPSDNLDVVPACTTIYTLDTVSVLVEGTSPGVPPPMCGGTQIDLFNQSFSGEQTVLAPNIITAEQVVVLAGAVVGFRAGEMIALHDGFVVEPGASFSIHIEPCLCE